MVAWSWKAHSKPMCVMWPQSFKDTCPYREIMGNFYFHLLFLFSSMNVYCFCNHSRYSIREGNGSPLQYSCLENPMDSMKRQKAMTPEDEPPARKVSSMLLGNTGGWLLIAPEKMKHLGQSINDVQWWMCLVVKVKSDAIKKTLHRNLEC